MLLPALGDGSAWRADQARSPHAHDAAQRRGVARSLVAAARALTRDALAGHLASRSKRLGVLADTLRLPPVTHFDAAETREREWANVVTVHEGQASVYTWRVAARRIAEHVLRPDNARRCASR